MIKWINSETDEINWKLEDESILATPAHLNEKQFTCVANF